MPKPQQFETKNFKSCNDNKNKTTRKSLPRFTRNFLLYFTKHVLNALLMVNSLPLTASIPSCFSPLPPSQSFLTLISAVVTSWWDSLIQFKTFPHKFYIFRTHENTVNKLKLCADCNNMSTRVKRRTFWVA